MDLDNFLNDYFYFYKFSSINFEAAEKKEFLDCLPEWIDRCYTRVLDSRS